MYSAVFCIALLVALLGLAESDFHCFEVKMKVLDRDFLKIFGEGKNCQDGKKRFIDSLQQAIDECSVPVKTDSMNSFLDEVCDPSTELSQTLEESGGCLNANKFQNVIDSMNCNPNRLDKRLPVKEACLKMKRQFLNCSANKIGGRCGEKTVEALERIYKTSDSLTDGFCDEIAAKHSKSVSGYIHWIVIAVLAVIALFIGIYIKCIKGKKPVPVGDS